MIIHGKVIKVYPNERIIQCRMNNRLVYLYLSRKAFKDFGPYFLHFPYVFVEISNTREHYGNFYAYEVLTFIKVMHHFKREQKVYYDLTAIRKSIKQLMEKKNYKIFLDLEFSLPSYTHNKIHVPEIVQYGMVVENENGEIIFEDKSLVEPTKSYSLNKRTLKFLGKTIEDFKESVPYVAFYLLLEKFITEFDAKIIVWGKNDMLTIEQSFKLNRLQPLDIRNRYINLMQIMKNYYAIKNDLGLFDTYRKLSSNDVNDQIHDAFQDAQLEREIFHLFKQHVMNHIVLL